jgi:N-acetylglucosamine kinase-like BadF-type ATPase
VGVSTAAGRAGLHGVLAGAVLAVDGGNSKTEVALAAWDGTVLAAATVGGFVPHRVGVAGAVDTIAAGVAEIRRILSLPDVAPVADLVSAYLANADFPVEVETLTAEIAERGWGDEITVDNDVFALLRSGTENPWGVAVVCGAGINCVGIGPDGRRARFPAIGRVSGDWGGGWGIGEEAHWFAARADDGRGAPTMLRKAIPEFFGFASMPELIEAMHFGLVAEARFGELAPLVMEVASLGDEVALAIVDRLADEVCALGTVALGRLDLLDAETEVVLGGGVLRAQPPVLMERIRARFAERAPKAVLKIAENRPIHGAVLLGLDRLAVR